MAHRCQSINLCEFEFKPFTAPIVSTEGYIKPGDPFRQKTVTKSIINSKFFVFQTPQYLVVAESIVFCWIPAMKGQSQFIANIYS